MQDLRFALAVASICGFVACSVTTIIASPPGETPQADAGMEAAIPMAPASGDAAVGTDARGVYPAPHPPIPEMQFGGGRVLTHPALVTVTFEGMDTALRDVVRDFDDKILTTPWWATSMDGYGVGKGSGNTSIELPDAFAGKTTTDADLTIWLAAQITEGKLPAPTDQTVYVLFMPGTAIIDLDGTQSCTGFGGYHNSAELVTEGGKQRFLYAVVNECYATFKGVTATDIVNEETEVASHEIAEVATDPDINVPGLKSGYYLIGNDAWAPDQRGGEVGDLCAGRTVQEGTFAVTQVWNMAAARASHSPCVPARAPVFFSAAPVTEVPGQKFGGAPSSGGYIVVSKVTHQPRRDAPRPGPCRGVRRGSS